MKFLFLIISLFFGFAATAQDANSMLAEASKIEMLPNESLALSRYKDILKIYPQNITALSKSSELCSRIGSRESAGVSQNAWYDAALQYANRAIAFSPRSDQANVSKAMIIGKSSLTKSSKEKIKGAKEIKQLLDIALATNPKNYLAWHILGRWNYELSNVNSFERAAARVFVTSVPEGSLKNSIICFENARKLSPDFILNNIELAKAYYANNQPIKGINLLQEAIKMPVTTEDDPRLKQKAHNLINDWK